MQDIEVILSVIVPIYGVEKYIERCARSLLEQSLTVGIEYIFVNDCTPDRSIAILENVINDYPYRKDQCHIIHHEKNLGLPSARRDGINIAKGKYIAHCDSDDWVEKDAYRTIVHEIMLHNPDMIECNYSISDGLRTKIPNSKYTKQTILNIFNINGIQFRYNGPYVWNKVIKADLYKQGIVFPVANIAEDVVLTMQLCLLCRTYSIIDTPLYHYFVNDESLTQLKRNQDDVIKRHQSFKQNVDFIVEILQQKNLSAIYKDGVMSLKLLACNELLPFIHDNRIYGLWRSAYPELTFINVVFSGIPLRKKILYTITRLRLYHIISKKWIK